MKSHFRTVACFVLALLCLIADTALTENKHEWGKVTPEEWAYQPPAEYPHSAAVILFDEGHWEVSRGDCSMERYRRYKIFNKQMASDVIDVQIPYNMTEHFSGFRAQTILPNGKKLPFKSLDLMKSRIGDAFEVVSFSFPGVENGCIVELSYKLKTGYKSFQSWEFQNDLYTCESHFSYNSIPNLEFSEMAIGFSDSVSAKGDSTIQTAEKQSKDREWTKYNVPPLPDEPFAGARLNYLPAVYLQQSVYSTKNFLGFGIAISFETGWSDITTWLGGAFGWALKSNDTLVAILDSLTKDCGRNLEAKVHRIHAFVRDAIALTDANSAYFVPTQTTTETLEKHSGSAADKNALLMEMLRLIKLDAVPLLIATRPHALLRTDVLNTKQLNYALVYFKVGSTPYILDASEKGYPFLHLPPALRAEIGLLPTGYVFKAHTKSEDTLAPEPIDTLRLVHSNWMSGIRNEASVWLNDDGSAVCTTHVRIMGYTQNQRLTDSNDAISTEDVTAILPMLRVKTFEILQAARSNSPDGDSTMIDLILNIPNFGSGSGGVVECVPSLVWPDKKLFSDESRQFPIDFAYPAFISESIDVHLNSKAKTATVPQAINQMGKDLMFSRAVLAGENSARIMTNMMIKRCYYTPDEYSTVKAFFDKIDLTIGESYAATVSE